ncbi:hypothetical protein Pyn_41249 [Prunus yedoensis var. nudiflora]|uniref:Uncharacterized protein n=1 Tax=Prunus yedoensis var. nudiflora TaxID=2094558 RepID=A0A314ZL93_PRUYE|nr:hypothetical protein Pyn_41249 [Prunus yedoensis var. nudiflora]
MTQREELVAWELSFHRFSNLRERERPKHESLAEKQVPRFCAAEPLHGGEAPLSFSLGFQIRACRGKRRTEEVVCPLGISPTHMGFLWFLRWLLVDRCGIFKIGTRRQIFNKDPGWASFICIGLLVSSLPAARTLSSSCWKWVILLGFLTVMDFPKCYSSLWDVLLRYWTLFFSLMLTHVLGPGNGPEFQCPQVA